MEARGQDSQAIVIGFLRVMQCNWTQDVSRRRIPTWPDPGALPALDRLLCGRTLPDMVEFSSLWSLIFACDCQNEDLVLEFSLLAKGIPLPDDDSGAGERILLPWRHRKTSPPKALHHATSRIPVKCLRMKPRGIAWRAQLQWKMRL